MTFAPSNVGVVLSRIRNLRIYGTPTWIWSVVVEDTLYVRAYNGRQSRWYQAALFQKAGRITAAGMIKDVAFEPVEGTINDRIDKAYRSKYHTSPYLDPMIGKRARSATVRIIPPTRAQKEINMDASNSSSSVRR